MSRYALTLSKVASLAAMTALTAGLCFVSAGPAHASLNQDDTVSDTATTSTTVTPASWGWSGSTSPRCGGDSVQVIWTSPLSFITWVRYNGRDFRGTMYTNDGFRGFRSNGTIYHYC